MYTEITQPKEIQECVERLRAVLARKFAHRLTRVVGWPNDHREGVVGFAAKEGLSVPWVVVSKDKNTGNHVHLLGRGDPRGVDSLLINLQFNYASQGFDRRTGGAFVKDDEGEFTSRTEES